MRRPSKGGDRANDILPKLVVKRRLAERLSRIQFCLPLEFDGLRPAAGAAADTSGGNLPAHPLDHLNMHPSGGAEGAVDERTRPPHLPPERAGGQQSATPTSPEGGLHVSGLPPEQVDWKKRKNSRVHPPSSSRSFSRTYATDRVVRWPSHFLSFCQQEQTSYRTPGHTRRGNFRSGGHFDSSSSWHPGHRAGRGGAAGEAAAGFGFTGQEPLFILWLVQLWGRGWG